jgi:hypothetical protein
VSVTAAPEQPSGWQFEIEEISVGVYRVTGLHASGKRVVTTGTDLLALTAEFQTIDQGSDAGSAVVEALGLRLSDRWGPRLAVAPETGMGYQVVSILLKDGRRFDNVTIVGGVISTVGCGDSIPFVEDEIVQIFVTHGTVVPVPSDDPPEAAPECTKPA